tara:strand:- start:9799 stop:10686 length:888 start_codon:yes stop_codon:yes gene_type:complete
MTGGYSIIRNLPLTKSQNNCQYPYTNNKQWSTTNNDIYINQYSNRMIITPEMYMIMVKKMLNDLSEKNINVGNIDHMLKEIDYTLDQGEIINFFNKKLDEIISVKSYLQQNGTWKYERFFCNSPEIFLYEVDNSNKQLKDSKGYDLPYKFYLFKIIFVLSNPLRSSYTSCFAFITVINNVYEIQYTNVVNDPDKKFKDNLDVIPKEALNFSFINNIENLDFDQFGHSNDYTGLNYINEPRDGLQVNIKPDIPNEFKTNSFKAYLPPLFGNGICKYPPYYKDKNGVSQYYNNPPLY